MNNLERVKSQHTKIIVHFTVTFLHKTENINYNGLTIKHHMTSSIYTAEMGML